MSARLVITLDEEATKNYLARARAITAAHIDADCEPIGVTLTVEISPIPFWCSVSMDGFELGEVAVKLIEQGHTSE